MKADARTSYPFAPIAMYYGAVAVLATLERCLDEGSLSRTVLTVTASVGFMGGIVGWGIHGGWAAQRQKRRPVIYLLAGLLLAAVVNVLAGATFVTRFTGTGVSAPGTVLVFARVIGFMTALWAVGGLLATMFGKVKDAP